LSEFVHSVSLDVSKCTGCTNCVKRCPTEAIRVKDGRAVIESAKCIDCGECIRVCPRKAKTASSDSFEIINDYKYKIALPAPALYGQFDHLEDIDYVLNGLLECGFDEVFEVARAAELVTEYTREYLKKADIPKPVISSACPAVVRLISVRFPSLCENVLPILAPVEYAARIAKNKALEEHPELKEEEIGAFFISPCPAKVSYVRQPIGVEKSAIDGVISIKEMYFKLVPVMNKIKHPEPLSQSGRIGVSWAGSGGEASALYNSQYLAADGIENVIKVLEEIENKSFGRLQFVELNACYGGCVGGCLNVENPYISKARLHIIRRYLPVSNVDTARENRKHFGTYKWKTPLAQSYVLRLDEDMATAMRKMAKIKDLERLFRGKDCAACGAPSCHALAEDIVQGKAKLSDCVFCREEDDH